MELVYSFAGGVYLGARDSELAWEVFLEKLKFVLEALVPLIFFRLLLLFPRMLLNHLLIIISEAQ